MNFRFIIWKRYGYIYFLEAMFVLSMCRHSFFAKIERVCALDHCYAVYYSLKCHMLVAVLFYKTCDIGLFIVIQRQGTVCFALLLKNQMYDIGKGRIQILAKNEHFHYIFITFSANTTVP
jgi:hypothetical protein